MMLRLIIDSLVAVMVAGVLGAVIMFNRQDDESSMTIEQTREALREIQQQITLQIALEQVELNDFGYPRTIDPAWFQVDLPRNALLTGDRPWMEVAGLDDRRLRHPAKITAGDKSLATFWYNPYLGIVRARVPDSISDAVALDAYNAVNASNLVSLVPTMND